MNKMMIAAVAALSLAAFQASAQSYSPSVASHEQPVVHQAPVVSGQQEAGANYTRGTYQNQSQRSDSGLAGAAGGF